MSSDEEGFDGEDRLSAPAGGRPRTDISAPVSPACSICPAANGGRTRQTGPRCGPAAETDERPPIRASALRRLSPCGVSSGGEMAEAPTGVQPHVDSEVLDDAGACASCCVVGYRPAAPRWG